MRSNSAELIRLRARNEELSSQVTQLQTEASGLRSELSTAPSTASSAVLTKVRAEHDRYLRLLRSLVSQFDRIEEDYGNLMVSVRDSRSSLRRGIGPLLDEFRSSPDPVDEDPPDPRTS